jgi:aminoglycoside phosphotransferase (APT) family kinase protein
VGDLIDVRKDEGFDVESLVTWAQDHEALPPGRPKVMQFGGGKANLTYLLTYPDGIELVLRRPPLGPVAASSHDMSREYRVLARLWRSFDKAARAIALCENVDVIGSPFFLMERRGGIVVRGQVPDVFGSGTNPTSNRALSEIVIQTLAELHGVNPDDCDLGDLGHPQGFLDRQVSGWAGRWKASKHEENAVADEVAAWLAAELPESPRPTLLHNDWRLDNMALEPGDPAVCTAVYDWDMATRGDPLADLGTLMGSWFDPGEAPEALGLMPTTVNGWMDRTSAVDLYGELTGTDMRRVDWYLVFGAWKLGVVLQQIYIRWLRGQTKDERFRTLDQGANHLFRLAADRRP